MKFTNYLQPESIEEALKLAGEPDTVILGGMMWSRMQKREFKNAVDLSLLNLDRIEEKEDGIHIGAYVTLRQAETDPLLSDYTGGAIGEAFMPIVGVQFRNSATVGGSIFGRFGFSDVATLFTALGAKVCLAGKGILPMETFIKEGAPRDLLTEIILPSEKPEKVVMRAHRNSATDFPVLTMAVCKRKEALRITVSPAPIRGMTVDASAEDGAAVLKYFTEEAGFSGDRNASKEYRAHLAEVFLRRSLSDLGVLK